MLKTSTPSFSGSALSKVSKQINSIDHLNLLLNDSGYYDVDVGLPEAIDGMRVMAIGDMNNDKMNDLITINDSAQSITVYYFSEASLKFSS